MRIYTENGLQYNFKSQYLERIPRCINKVSLQKLLVCRIMSGLNVDKRITVLYAASKHDVSIHNYNRPLFNAFALRARI